MEKILETLVSSVGTGESESHGENSKNQQSAFSHGLVSDQSNILMSTNSRPGITSATEGKDASSLVEEDMDDVMNVLKDLNDVASGSFVSNANSGITKSTSDENAVPENVVDSLTSVQDVAKVVDISKACLNSSPSNSQISAYQAAEEKFAKLSARQSEIEKRFAKLSNRINDMRCRQFGSHVVNELTNLRSFYENITTPKVQGNQVPFYTNNHHTVSAPISSGHSNQTGNLLLPSNQIVTGSSIGVQLHNSLNQRSLSLEGVPLPTAPVQINSSSPSYSSQPMSTGITKVPQIQHPLSLPTTPLDPSDIAASTTNFGPGPMIKCSVSEPSSVAQVLHNERSSITSG